MSGGGRDGREGGVAEGEAFLKLLFSIETFKHIC